MSLVVQNLYQFSRDDSEVFERIFEAQKEFRRMLEDRAVEVVKKNLEEFKEFYEGKARPKTHQQWVNVCFKQLEKDVKTQNGTYLAIYSDFIPNLFDFLVDIVLYKHSTEGYFIQIFGSPWAVNEIKSLLHLSKDYSFDNRSDWGYEDEKGMERMEKDYNFLIELFPESKFKDNGITITISNEVPWTENVLSQLKKIKGGV